MALKSYRIVAVVAAFILATGHVSAPSQTSSHNEYEVKAAFICNFTKFVEWPARTFSDSEEPLVIGIIGDNPFGSSLERAVKGKTVDGRDLVIKRFSKISECSECHLLFISSSEDRRLSKILDEVKSSSVLTIGEMERFTRRGGMIGFVVSDNKVGFEVNVIAAKRANLKISSKLLKLAKAVRD